MVLHITFKNHPYASKLTVFRLPNLRLKLNQINVPMHNDEIIESLNFRPNPCNVNLLQNVLLWNTYKFIGSLLAIWSNRKLLTMASLNHSTSAVRTTYGQERFGMRLLSMIKEWRECSHCAVLLYNRKKQFIQTNRLITTEINVLKIK